MIPKLFNVRWLAVGLVVALLAGFLSGWKLKSTLVDAREKEQAQAYSAALEASLKNAIAQFEVIREQDNEILVSMIEERDQIARAHTEIVKEIYADEPDNACSAAAVPDRTVRMLNLARTGSESGMRAGEAPESLAPEARAPEPITNRQEYEFHAECGIRYRQLAARYNALIDWYESQTAEK